MEQNRIDMPVLALRGLTIFPNMLMHFDVEREISVKALEAAMEQNQDIFLVAQREIATEVPGQDDLYTVGTVSHIRQILRVSDGNVRVMIEGRQRAHLTPCCRRRRICWALWSCWRIRSCPPAVH